VLITVLVRWAPAVEPVPDCRDGAAGTDPDHHLLTSTPRRRPVRRAPLVDGVRTAAWAVIVRTSCGTG
jgi:hypothetical protein